MKLVQARRVVDTCQKFGAGHQIGASHEAAVGHEIGACHDISVCRCVGGLPSGRRRPCRRRSHLVDWGSARDETTRALPTCEVEAPQRKLHDDDRVSAGGARRRRRRQRRRSVAPAAPSPCGALVPRRGIFYQPHFSRGGGLPAVHPLMALPPTDAGAVALLAWIAGLGAWGGDASTPRPIL